MSDFYFTRLEEGEEIVFGVVTSSSSSSSNVSVLGNQVAGSSESSQRKLGITNRRVIIEQAEMPEATRIIINTDVRRISAQQEEFMGQPRLNITSLETAAGDTIDVGMPLTGKDDDARLRLTFPGAEITVAEEEKGWFGNLLDKIGLG